MFKFARTEETTTNMSYLDYKVSILFQLGLKSNNKVAAYLEEKSKGADTELQRKIRIDNAARKILMDFYDGDKTYVDYDCF